MKGKHTIQKLFYKSATYLKRNSSTILTVASAVGVVATAATVATATPKALKRVSKAQEAKGEDLTTLEAVVAAAPAYIPSAVIGVSTIACIFGANILNKRQQAALVSAYALVDGAYKDYRNKVREMLGEETDIKICDAIMKDKREEGVVAYAPGLNPGNLDGEKCLFYDEYGERYFEASMNEVLNAEYHLNRNFTLRGCASVNEFYSFLGLENAVFGDAVGWSAVEFIEGGLMPWIDFDHRTTKIEDGSEAGLECTVISYVFGPSTGYDEY